MFLDERKVGTGHVEVVVCSPQALDLLRLLRWCRFGITGNSCQKEYVASYLDG